MKINYKEESFEIPIRTKDDIIENDIEQIQLENYQKKHENDQD